MFLIKSECVCKYDTNYCSADRTKVCKYKENGMIINNGNCTIALLSLHQLNEKGRRDMVTFVMGNLGSRQIPHWFGPIRGRGASAW